MPTNQEIASASKSTDPNCISFFGPPPLLKGEDPRAYDDLLLRVLGAVNPSDLFEEIWTRDYVDHTWEVFRGRRLKASLLTAKMTVALERLLVRPLNLPLELEYISVFKPTLGNELAQKWRQEIHLQ